MAWPCELNTPACTSTSLWDAILEECVECPEGQVSSHYCGACYVPCTPPMAWDEDLCRCIYHGDVPAGVVAESRECPHGMVRSPCGTSDGPYICHYPCPPFQSWNIAECRCNTWDICPPGLFYNVPTGTCISDCATVGRVACGGMCFCEPPKPECCNQVHPSWNSQECRWECGEINPPTCAATRNCVYNWETCSYCCDYYITAAGPTTSVLDGSQCPQDYVWDSGIGDCVYVGEVHGCPSGFTWNDDYGQCVQIATGAAEEDCVAPSEWHSNGDCVTYVCSPPFFWNTVLGACLVTAPGNKFCQGGIQGRDAYWDAACGQCTEYICPPGQTLGAGCVCVPECPEGQLPCGDECVEPPVPPSCFDELNCAWDATACEWHCDTPDCPEGQTWSTARCACVEPTNKDYHLSTTLNQFQTEYFVFRRGGDGDEALYLDTYVVNPVPPVNFSLDNTATVIARGASPSIIKLRDHSVSLAYVDLDAEKVKRSIWSPHSGARNVQEIADGSLVTHVQDKWSRIIYLVYVADWNIVVGKLQAGGRTYELSAPAIMRYAATGNQMNGLEASASIIALPDGSVMVTFTEIGGTVKHVTCKVLNDDGTGGWT